MRNIIYISLFVLLPHIPAIAGQNDIEACFLDPSNCGSIKDLPTTRAEINSKAWLNGDDVYSEKEKTGFVQKKGYVYDEGQFYKGASPTNILTLIETANSGGDTAGIANNSVFIVIEEDVIFVPISDLAGKEKEQMHDYIRAAVTKKIVFDSSGVELDIDELVLSIDEADGDLNEALVRSIESSVSVENVMTSAERVSLSPSQISTSTLDDNVSKDLEKMDAQEIVGKTVSFTEVANISSSANSAIDSSRNDLVAQYVDRAVGRATQSLSANGSLNSKRSQIEIQRVRESATLAANQMFNAGVLEGQISKSISNITEALASGSLRSKVDGVISAAIEAVDRAGADIDMAVDTWDAMSADQKQAVVDQVNSTGALGCSSCTLQDAENFADSKR